MTNPFFDHPILNSLYEFPLRHWELDSDGQPTQKTLEIRRSAKFVKPIPEPKKRKGAAKQEGFVRHAYFLGANDPYSAIKTTFKAEIDQGAWATLNSGTSRPFEKPTSGQIAVKVINHLGDEVMKVFKVG